MTKSLCQENVAESSSRACHCGQEVERKDCRESPRFLPLSHQAPRADMVPEGIRLSLSPQLVFPGNNLTDTLEVCLMVT